MKKLVSISLSTAALLFACGVAAPCGGAYHNTIPSGYKAEVVLHLNYGSGPGKTKVVWGDEESNSRSEDSYTEPACLKNLQVRNNSFYFFDPTSSSIVQYRSPDVLVWRVENVGSAWSLRVSPQGDLCVSGGIAGDELACINPNGKVVWTTSYEKLFPYPKPQEIKQKFNLSESYGEFRQIDWVGDQLQIRLGARDNQNQCTSLWVLLDHEGKLLGVSQTRRMGPDKTSYKTTSTVKERNGKPVISNVQVTAIDLSGKQLGETKLDLEVDNGVHLKGDPTIEGFDLDVDGGYVVIGEDSLPAKVKTNSHFAVDHDHVMWRFSRDGTLKEEWRFPQNMFAWGDASTAIDDKGNVYHIEYGDTGLDVVKYSKG